MKRVHTIAAALALALGLAAFTGTAFAGGGNDHSSGAPGQEKKSEAPQQQQQQWQQPQQQQSQQSQPQSSQPASQPASKPAEKHSAPAKTHSAPAKTSSSSSKSHGIDSTSAGTKPSSTTSKRTHTTVGASPDVSKRYGNGKTAAQIAKSRGAGDDVELYGPGNSQPHKVATCKHPLHGNGGGVDVHAVKSYSTTDCTQAPAAVHATEQQRESVQTVCGQTTVRSSRVVGVMHVDGKGRDVHLMTNPKSAHFSKHADDRPVVVESTRVVATGENCSPAAGTPSVQGSVQTAQNAQAVQSAQSAQSAPAAPAAPAAAAATPAASGQAAPAAGGVLGAQATLTQPAAAQPAGQGGVLGAVAQVAGTTLPFTGLALWIAVLIALALIALGVLMRRRGRGTAGI